MALNTASEFKKHADTREVVFKKDYVGKNGKIRYKTGKTYYMHKDVAEKVSKFADVKEVDWKKLYTAAKAAYQKAKDKAEKTQQS